MKTLLTLITLLLALTVPAFAGKKHCHSHRCDNRCHGDRHHSNHHCDDEHCNGSCAVVVTNTVVVQVPVLVHVTNRVVETVTNTVTQFETNYVDCPSLPSADFELLQNHSYRVYVAIAGSNKPWSLWGVIRCPTNTQARIFLPMARTKGLVMQVVDWTPGFPRTALTYTESDCEEKPTWVVLGRGRVLQAR